MSKPNFTNLHMSLTPRRAAGQPTRWVCGYCGAEGLFDDMSHGGCTYAYEPCEHCGGCETSNECKPDCPGILAILADPSVYVAGKGVPE